MGKLSLGSWAALLCLFVAAACSSEDAASGNTSSTCLSDSDCTLGLRCDQRVGCVGCLFDTHCADGQRCDRGNCATRIPCTSSADCKSEAAPACDLALGECFPCAVDQDCKTGEKCDSHACRPYTACTNSLDCPTGKVCNAGEGECVSCVGNADCGSEELCVDNECVARCASDKDCAAQSLLCDPDAKHCVECVSSSDCPARYHCAEGSCERDSCEEGASRCVEGGAVESCTPPGSGWLKLLCGSQQSCRSVGGLAQCEGWVCTPGSMRCSTDGQRVETCTADGLGTTIAMECDAAQTCVDGVCKGAVCTPGRTFCQSGDVYECNADGSAKSLRSTCFGYTYCDAEAGACLPKVCTPGERSCIEGRQGVCNALGSGFEDLKDCGTDQVCVAGACTDIVCDPDAYACDDENRLRRCNGEGTSSDIVSNCGSDRYCRVEGKTHECSPHLCRPGQAVCDGSIATTCNETGNGYTAGGTDCATSGDVCSAGECQPKVCDAGQRYCADGSVRLCNAQGTASQPFDTCAESEFCDEVSATCKTELCTPDAPSCNGNVAAQCNADGSGYVAAGAVDCSPSNKQCEAGACKTKVCTPNTRFCQAGNVHDCNALGTGSTLYMTCTESSYFCSQTGGTASCSYDVCSAGTKGCSGNTVTTCKADGSGYELGADCGAKVCNSGACATKVCTPGAFQCSGAVSQTCNNLGTAWVDSATCSGDTHCKASSGRCELDICPAAAKACVNEALGTCTTDGSGVGAGATDCKATSKVCTLAGCAATATDTLGDASSHSYFGSYSLYGDIVYVTAARKLTELQQYLINPSGQLRWVIYSATTLAGPYQPVFDQASTSTSTGFQSSGALSFQLEAGKYYFFGVLGNPTYWGSLSTTAAQYASFGRVVGSYNRTASVGTVPASFTFSSSSSSIANIKLVTTP